MSVSPGHIFGIIRYIKSGITKKSLTFLKRLPSYSIQTDVHHGSMLSVQFYLKFIILKLDTTNFRKTLDMDDLSSKIYLIVIL